MKKSLAFILCALLLTAGCSKTPSVSSKTDVSTEVTSTTKLQYHSAKVSAEETSSGSIIRVMPDLSTMDSVAPPAAPSVSAPAVSDANLPGPVPTPIVPPAILAPMEEGTATQVKFSTPPALVFGEGTTPAAPAVPPVVAAPPVVVEAPPVVAEVPRVDVERTQHDEPDSAPPLAAPSSLDVPDQYAPPALKAPELDATAIEPPAAEPAAEPVVLKSRPPLRDVWKGDGTRILFRTTQGDITVELNPPGFTNASIAAFLALAREGRFNGTTFHSVTPSQITGGIWDIAWKNQLDSHDYLFPDTDLLNSPINQAGTLAIVRDDLRRLNGARGMFVFNLNENSQSNFSPEKKVPGQAAPGNCVIGKIVAGLDVAQKIGRTPVFTREEYDQQFPNSVEPYEKHPHLPSKPQMIIEIKELQ